ncbi:MAG TPA: HAMP domain-containing sensor histidine kinase [Acidimicrobiia bacterium]|nr:HAMP domain-containing sensor histidine kinase [Acidimicrobiia bacterium]
MDYATGPFLAMSVFYLIPVAWATAVAGRRVGAALAVLCVVLGLVSDVVLQAHFHHRLSAAFNVTFMLFTLLVVVELVDRLRERAAAALDEEQRSRDFLALAAHQLRTPIAGLRATVDALAAADHSDDEREQLLTTLGSEAARMGRLVNSLLRVAHLDQRESLSLQATDVGPIVDRELERMARARPELEWVAARSDSQHARAFCNADALAEAIANLLDNAGRHARTRVSAVIGSTGNVISIEIHDDGPGLPPGAADTAFERFATLDGHGGTGLGLPIARAIIEAHQGTLSYTDGSFRIELPTQRPAFRNQRSRERVPSGDHDGSAPPRGMGRVGAGSRQSA